MYASISFQNVTKIKANAYLDLESTPLIIGFESTQNDENGHHYSRGEIVIHLENAPLAKALVEAINRTIAEQKASSEMEVA